MTRDWFLTAYCLVAALIVAGFGVYASVILTEAFHHSQPVAFAKECLDSGGRASYTKSEDLVCMRASQIIDRMEL